MKTVSKVLLAVMLLSACGLAQDTAALRKAEITPQALVSLMRSNTASKLLILNVGPKMLYMQAHILGSEYVGAGSEPSGIAALRERVKSLPKNKAIVLYCGCCPWDRCPNIRPAFAELQKLGFSNVKVLYIADNIGSDWVDKGYPTTRGR